MNAAQIKAIANADTRLSNAGLPGYTDLIRLLREAQALGLRFDCGTAYIYHSYIDQQTVINRQINALPKV